MMSPVPTKASKALSSKRAGAKVIASRTLSRKGGSLVVVKGGRKKYAARSAATGKFVGSVLQRATAGSILTQPAAAQRPKKLKLDMSPEDAEFHNRIAEAAAKDLFE